MNSEMTPLLQNLSPELNAELLSRSIRKEYFLNEQIFAEDEQAEFLPIVLNGKVKMVRFPEAGKEIIIGVFGSGEIFAIPPALDGKRFPATAVAMEKTQLLILPRPDFLKLMQESSEFSAIVMERMCGLLRNRTTTAQILATPSSEKRVGAVLLQLAKQNKTATATKIEFRRQEIAEMSGLTVESTIRAIRSLAKRNYVEIVKGKVIVRDTTQLESFLR